ncbi:HD-GYP domain-containing protein [Marinitoga sp. 38H-ov]|uniref:HD-GYP domain-containing protein n=1 Tax=Marinitoga sp. 38H-ov TaxID=1755814 RepID=UPI0013EA2F38|nr:HD-GYP domain-containing protein [Marinitoga sp. 38H-ov]KAF2955687.1 hypothetical protein AS160_00820 [Marinitoga sp. 38H-ov]
MKFLSIDKVLPNMVLAMDVKDFSGKILYKKGTLLDESKIKNIKNNGIFRIPIKDVSNMNFDTYINTTISKELLEKSFIKIKNIFETLISTGNLNIPEIENITTEIVKEMSNNFSDKIFVPLKKLKNYDDYLYSHSLNVMILSTLIALDMGIKNDELVEIGLSGILHDVGKTKIPLEILNAPRKLSEKEFEFVKKHVLYTKGILEKSGFNQKKVIDGSIEHHERFDGTGYIFKKKGKDISLYGRILALSDVYDALTSKRSYKEPWSPYKTISYILSHVNKDFDPEISQNLINSLGLFPPGMKVMLNDNSEGIIVGTNRNNKMKPIVKINNEIIDLNEDKKLRIIKILDYQHIEDF